MTVDRREILMQTYRGFNERDIESATEFLAPDVDWPNVGTGGREHGRSAVRRYWENQWREIDPHVEPLVIKIEGDRAHVRVHQLICALNGTVLSDKKIEHVFTFDGAFIARMDAIDADPAPDDDEDDDDE